MEVTGEQIQRMKELAHRHDLSLILLFGSRVTGKEHPRSDTDVAVRFRSEVPGLLEQGALISDLQDILPQREVNLAVINRADPLFLKKIVENCRLLYGETRELHQLKIYAFKRYHDHRPYFQMERNFVNRFLKKTRQAATKR